MVRLHTFSLAFIAALACHSAVGETVLVEFTTQHCGPCRRMRPIMQRLASEGYAVREIDASIQPQAAAQYQVSQFPTFLVLVDGREYARLEGGTSHAQLVEMMHRATAIAAQKNREPASRQAIALVDSNSEFASPATFAASQQGQVFQLQAPRQSAVDQPPTSSHDATAPGPASSSAGQETVDAAHLVNATVRLSVDDSDGQSTGAGTIIDARQGKALILTCGHLFRASQGKGAIEVSLFRAGPQGAQLHETVAGQLIDYDLERDLALVCFSANGPVAVTPVAPLGTPLLAEAPATSVGCEHGANPTPWTTRITAVNRYQGHPNVEAAGAPVEGRSGGGLFNAAGQLIGVCFAADPQRDEGLYASLESVHAKLNALGLSHIHQTPSTGGAAATPLAAAPAPLEIRGQSPTGSPAGDTVEVVNPFTNVSAPAAAPTTPAAVATTVLETPSTLAVAPPAVDPSVLPAEERAALQEIGRRAGDSEVIVIIRPRAPTGRSDVIKLNAASPQFVEMLEAAAQPAAAGEHTTSSPSNAVVR